MKGYLPVPGQTPGQLLHAAVHCLMDALDAERVMDPLRINIVTRFLTGTTPEEQRLLQGPRSPDAEWTPGMRQAAADVLLADLAQQMSMTEDEALEAIARSLGISDA